MSLLLLVALGIAAWKWVPRPWHPTVTLQTAHYYIRSTATKEQTDEVSRHVELLYLAYSNRFGALPKFTPAHGLLQMKLYRDRKELRRVNPGLGWAEAFYRKPFCQAYYSAAEINPYHWMIHEATHQLNAEVAHVDPEKWLEEGVADYFGSARFVAGKLVVGSIDPNTYPAWWLDDIATTPSLKTNIANGSIIPLRQIVSGHGGPAMNSHVNLYYLHWWTLAHYLFETERHRRALDELLVEGGSLAGFERLIGPIDEVEPQWHEYVLRIKAAVAGHDPQFLKTGRLR